MSREGRGAIKAANKLISRLRTKAALAIGCAALLAVGALTAPPAVRQEPSSEKIAPMLEAEVARQEPLRALRGLQDVGRRAVKHLVRFRIPETREPTIVTFSDRGAPTGSQVPEDRVGVLVSGDGDVLTHVQALGGAREVAAVLADGQMSRARLTAVDGATGLALVHLDAADGSPALIREEPLSPGELAVAVRTRGSQSVIAPTFLSSANDQECELGTLGGPARPGTPIFTLDGDLTVVASSGSRGVAAAGLLRGLRARAAEGRGLPTTLGLVFEPMTPRLAERLGAGALVADVYEDGPADRAGVRVGEVLVRIGDLDVTSVEQAVERIAGLDGDAEVALGLRSGRTLRQVRVVPTVAFLPRSRGGSTGVAAERLFPRAALAAAGVPADAQVLSLEGRPTVSRAAAQALMRRRSGPWLIHVESGARRFFALVDRTG
jgi:S1-C subfamily serine protease